MKSLKNYNFYLFQNEGFLFENRIIRLSAEGPKPVDPFAEGIDEPEKGKTKPGEKPEDVRKTEAKEAVTTDTKQKLDRYYEALHKQQQILVNGFVKMANRQEMSSEEKTTVKNYFQNVQNHDYRDIRLNLNDHPVQLTVSKSMDGKYLRVNLLVKEDSKGYEPTLIGKGNKEWVNFFNAKGEAITGKDEGLNKAKFPFKEEISPNKGKEAFDLTKPEGKLANFLQGIESKDYDLFQKESENIMKLIDRLQPNEGKLTKLPGGYTISNITPNKPDIKPSIVVFKDGKAVCYILNNKLTLPSNSKEKEDNQHAEIISANYSLDLALKEIKWTNKKWNISPKTFNQIQASIQTFSKFVSDEFQRDRTNPAKPTLNYNLPESRAFVSYWRLDSRNGSFNIILPGGAVLGFNTLKPDSVFMRDKTNRWQEYGKDKFVLNKAEREQEKTTEERQRIEDAKKAEEKTKEEYEKRIKGEEETVKKDYEKNETDDNIKSLYKQDFVKHLKQTLDKPYDVEVAFKGNKREVERLERKLGIKDMLNIPGYQKCIEVTVTHKGVETKGMYYPGQDNVYILKTDKKTNTEVQTKNPIKIFNGDKIKIIIKDPEENDFRKLNDKSYKASPEQINQNLNLAERSKLLEKFNALKGTPKDLDAKAFAGLKELAKDTRYDPNTILDKNRNLSDPLAMIDVQNKVLKAENALLKNAVIRLMAKASLEKPKTAPAAQPPDKLPGENENTRAENIKKFNTWVENIKKLDMSKIENQKQTMNKLTADLKITRPFMSPPVEVSAGDTYKMEFNLIDGKIADNLYVKRKGEKAFVKIDLSGLKPKK